MAPVFLAPADLWLFGWSLLGLWLVPATLGRAAWIFPAWFAIAGVFVIAAPDGMHPGEHFLVWLVGSQAPWVLLIPDLLARGRAARLLEAVPLRALLAWSLVHFMGVRHLLGALQGDLPAGFALETAAGETLSGLGALLLWLVYRPEKRWFRFLALFWNAHALVTSLALSARLLRTHTGLPVWGAPSLEIHGYFASWPGSMETFFWIPLAIGLHLAIFYKLLYNRDSMSPARFPGETPA
jgi:hypothetical protein